MGHNKATHTGECQWCGRRQLLPAGVLAKHGYTTRYGFFEGTCRGSGQLPYELSCELIRESVASVDARRAKLLARQAELLVPPTEPKAKLMVLNPLYNKMRGAQSRIEAEVEFFFDEHGIVMMRNSATNKTEFPGFYGCVAMTPLAAAEKANQQTALHLNGIIYQMTLYIDEQNRRIQNWVRRPLTPIAEK